MSESARALVAVGVDDNPQAVDALVLATTIASAASAELVVVTVFHEPASALQGRIGRTKAEAEALLHKLKAFMAPEVRTMAECDSSVPQALARVVRCEHADVLVVGSSRHASPGRVRIGAHARQLMREAGCPLAFAPRGLSSEAPSRLAVIGVGYDGTREADAAIDWAGSLARAARARLRVCVPVDDRLPYVGWTPVRPYVQGMWDDVIEPEIEALRAAAERRAAATGAEFTTEAERGAPVDDLIALSDEVDLLVIGAHPWGPAVRVHLGSEAEKLIHNARCSVMLVPRPTDQSREVEWVHELPGIT